MNGTVWSYAPALAVATALSFAWPAFGAGPDNGDGAQVPADAVSADMKDHPLSAFFGNTMIVVEHGRTMKIWYNPDRTFSAEEDDGFRFTGVWENKELDFCQTQTSAPRPGGQPWKRCGKIAPYKVGDSWERTSPDGSKVYISLVAGR